MRERERGVMHVWDRTGSMLVFLLEDTERSCMVKGDVAPPSQLVVLCGRLRGDEQRQTGSEKSEEEKRVEMDKVGCTDGEGREEQ